MGLRSTVAAFAVALVVALAALVPILPTAAAGGLQRLPPATGLSGLHATHPALSLVTPAAIASGQGHVRHGDSSNDAVYLVRGRLAQTSARQILDAIGSEIEPAPRLDVYIPHNAWLVPLTPGPLPTPLFVWGR